MSVTVVTRWSTPDIAANLDITKRAKAIWMKHGAEAFRANQAYSGAFTGQLLVGVVFPDLATYASAQAKAAPELQPLLAEAAKRGNVLQERLFLMGLDV